jgi:hypothetical protein
LLSALTCGLVACSDGGPRPAETPAQPAADVRRALASRPLPDFRHMRAVHMMGNWLGNTRGFAAPLLDDAPSLSAAQVSITGNVSTFVDGGGAMRTNDMALVTLTDVKLGALTLPRAGFWVYRNKATGESGLQFKPLADVNLAGISGFTADVDIPIPEAGKTSAPGNLDSARGDARQLVLAVIAHAPELVAGARAGLAAGATLGQPATLAAALGALRTGFTMADSQFFAHLKAMHVEWLGVSIAMHYDSVADPVVRTHQCASGTGSDAGGRPITCTFADADLRGFLARARAQGFKIYLTLAFEPALDLDRLPNSGCGSASYKMARWWLGAPELPANEAVARCVRTADWWWNPAHPEHAGKVQTFFSTYEAVAVKYAGLAQAAGVDLYSLGTETENLFRTRAGAAPYTNHFGDQLRAMVTAVRRVYHGALTYDQHYGAIKFPHHYGGAAGHEHLFNDLDLDVAGISAYFELADAKPDRLMSVAELEQSWESVFRDYLQPMRSRYPNKPIVFTEVGYVDDLGAPFDQASNAGQPKPAHAPGTSTPGMAQQANIYQALFNVNARHGDLVSGFFFWGNDYFPANADHCANVDWGLYCNAPARAVVTDAYLAWERADAARVFDWAQAVYPDLFGGPFESGAALGYFYRYYPSTGTYLGVHEASENVVVHHGRQFQFFNAGPLRGYLDQGRLAGY